MARCCNGTGTCACKIVAGERIEVYGIGSSQDPFVISADIGIEVLDTDQFNLTMTGTGTVDDPWVMSVAYASTAKLAGLPDVADTAPTNGQVLGWDDALQTWKPVAPAVAAPGAVSTDTSLDGDGSGGDPLLVRHDVARFTSTDADGIGLSDDGINSLVRRFATSAARIAAAPAPALDSLSMLDTAPGRIDHWTGAAWAPIKGRIEPKRINNQLLALSGAYVVGMPTTLLSKQVSANTSGAGVLQVLTAADLVGYAGVLSIHVDAVGAVGFTHTINPAVDRIEAVCRALDTGALLASTAVQATVTAHLY